MNLSPLSPNLVNLLSPNAALTGAMNRLAESEQSSFNFSNILSESLGEASRADAIDKASTLEMLMGQNDDLVGLMLDAQKAELALNLALQIRNKFVDAYTEVMRMQV